MTEVNIRTVSYDEWQKRMFEALKDRGPEIKPEEGERLALNFFLKLKEKMDAGE